MAATEHSSIAAELTPPYTVRRPSAHTVPFVLCSPHSGRTYTQYFLNQARLDPLTLRKSEDFLVDQLFSSASDLGAPLIAAKFPRAYLDANREPYELDPELFDDVLPDFANTQSVRVIGGLGTIARIVSDGEDIYRVPLRLEDALHRIQQLYTPFHDALAALLEETRRTFGYAILIDCHSMPSSLAQQGGSPRPQFVLGDRFGHACDQRLTRFLRETISGLGYDVQLNRPYAGGFITEHYGRPQRGIHAIQIEINRSLYMNETSITPNRGFDRLEADIGTMLQQTFETIPALLEHRQAAE